MLPDALPPPLQCPLWTGSSLTGKSLLLFAEQGLGDTIQFVRYVSHVKAAGARVIVQCPEPLSRLFATQEGIDRLVPEGVVPPAADFQAPLLSLPGIFGTDLTTIPAAIPYLAADPGLCERRRKRLSKTDGFKVGIAWQGNPAHKADRQRSVSLHAFAPLGGVPGVRLVSLQKGPGRDQLSGPASEMGVLDLTDQLIDFADTAALLCNLDVVITVDTAVAHLAGAVGVPVWVALAKVPDWRWLLDREDSPWYPSIPPLPANFAGRLGRRVRASGRGLKVQAQAAADE